MKDRFNDKKQKVLVIANGVISDKPNVNARCTTRNRPSLNVFIIMASNIDENKKSYIILFVTILK